MSQDSPKAADPPISPEVPETTPATESSRQVPAKKDPIRKITAIVLLICAFILLLYLVGDRVTPETRQAQLVGLIVPIVPRVSGHLTHVNVRLHSVVDADEVLFQIDKRPYELAVQKAEANVDLASQGVGARSATVKSSAARLGVMRAQLDRAQRNYNRMDRVRNDNPGAISQADWDRTETALSAAVENETSAAADLEKAKEQLGAVGPDNPDLRVAIAALEEAQLNLAFTTITAPSHGAIESFNVDLGFYAAAGQPLATLVSTTDMWIQADMRENNLGHIDPGDPVEFALDVAPGRVMKGTVRSIGYGVSRGDINRGELPTIATSKGWMGEPQRFPVIIGLNPADADSCLRVGGGVDVVVYTGRNWFMNGLAWMGIRVRSFFSYVR